MCGTSIPLIAAPCARTLASGQPRLCCCRSRSWPRPGAPSYCARHLQAPRHRAPGARRRRQPARGAWPCRRPSPHVRESDAPLSLRTCRAAETDRRSPSMLCAHTPNARTRSGGAQGALRRVGLRRPQRSASVERHHRARQQARAERKRALRRHCHVRPAGASSAADGAF
jgi:hypothetical protein